MTRSPFRWLSVNWLCGASLLAGAVGCAPPTPRGATEPVTLVAGDAADAGTVAPTPGTGDGTAIANPTRTAPAADVATAAGVAGRQLYARHCAACHAENGSGQGLAAKFLNPKPRDFRAGRFRLISTSNGVPSLEDLEAVLVRGMPGSSMVSWAHLTAEERRQLAEVVMAFRREGAADIERQLAAEAEEELTNEDLEERVATLTTPGQPFDPGNLPPATDQSVAHGKELYTSKGCAACHGTTGRGDGQQQMIDSEGYATRPRDLTLGIYKGSHDRVSVYRRLWLGLPGTPMPASQNLTPAEVAAMVDYVLSLSTEPVREKWVMRRRELTAQPLDKLPADLGDADWASIEATEVPLTPLWWRDGAISSVAVQAVRDQRELALRVSWGDATANERAVLPDEFEDMLAVQWSERGAEPFLGMGAPDTVIDLWQWRGGYRADGSEDNTSDEYPFDTPVYTQLAQGKPLPDFVTARVVGNPLAIRAGTAGSLSAGGPGSSTFLPKPSQVVEAQAIWKDGRWTVVLRRPLSVAADGGLSLAAGGHYSLALAVWDGAARDRAAQKAISLWNDLIIK